MKSVFSICKIFSVCFFISCPFFSCTKYLVVDGGLHVPKKVNIFITGFNTSYDSLTMVDDSGHNAVVFYAWPKQKIKWKISHSAIHSIDSIVAKAVNKNEIFSDGPRKKLFSKTWVGVIKSEDSIKVNGVKDFMGKYNYDYKIVWTDSGVQHTFDPRIQLKP